MCWSEKFCYVVPANFGCVLVGIFGFILSISMLATSVAYFFVESDQSHEHQLSASMHFGRAFGLDLKESSVHVILTIAIIVAVMWMLFSLMLVIGIVKNKPNFVLCYFLFGIIVTIVCQLSALLLLLEMSWVLALILFLLSLVHIHVLVVVHTVYELMLRGKDFRFRPHQDDEDPLADCFDDDTSRI